MKSTTLVQFEMSQSAKDRLQLLKDKTEAASYAEVTRRALKLYDWLLESRTRGAAILIRDREGAVREPELGSGG